MKKVYGPIKFSLVEFIGKLTRVSFYAYNVQKPSSYKVETSVDGECWETARVNDCIYDVNALSNYRTYISFRVHLPVSSYLRFVYSGFDLYTDLMDDGSVREKFKRRLEGKPVFSGIALNGLPVESFEHSAGHYFYSASLGSRVL